MSIFNKTTNGVYGENPKRKEPKRKHVKCQTCPSKEQVFNKVAHQETIQERQELVDSNEVLHARQMELKRKKFLGLI